MIWCEREQLIKNLNDCIFANLEKALKLGLNLGINTKKKQKNPKQAYEKYIKSACL